MNLTVIFSHSGAMCVYTFSDNVMVQFHIIRACERRWRI